MNRQSDEGTVAVQAFRCSTVQVASIVLIVVVLTVRIVTIA
ncbi:MAG TPA: hypothetical protein VKV15_09960 [Bryobacteraceae bacterium]|nr:hypothetical protein [Bryobacteraceae bacterium]